MQRPLQEERLGQGAELLLLAVVDGFVTGPETRAATCLHLAEDQRSAAYDHEVTTPEWCTGYRWDIVLTGGHRTPAEAEGSAA